MFTAEVSLAAGTVGAAFEHETSAVCPAGDTCSTKKLKRQCLKEAKRVAQVEAEFECAEELGLPKGFAAQIENSKVVKENTEVQCEFKGTFQCNLPSEKEEGRRGIDVEERDYTCSGVCKSSDAQKCTLAAGKDADYSLREDCIDAGGVPMGRYITLSDFTLKPGDTKLKCKALVGIECRQ